MSLLSSLNKRTLLADAQAGFLVFLIALPLCLGISVASGFPPVAGILTAVIGGFVASALAGSALTIKGPAAGMIVIVLGAVTELGQGDPVRGYHQALAVGVAAAVLQMALAFFRTARLGITLSRSVVHGMLAAIGVIIIAKQIHVALGVKPESKEILGLIAEIPHSIMNANPMLALIGGISVTILLAWPMLLKRIPASVPSTQPSEARRRTPWGLGLFKPQLLKRIPAQLIVLGVVIPLSLMLDLQHPHPYHFFHHDYSVTAASLVQLPSSLFSGVAFPDFSAILTLTSLKYIIMFALVGTIESTLSVVAVDALDPQKRTSNLDRDLFAVASGNLVSSLLGGLPMISEIVRSKANVDAGATSPRANMFHGMFLLMFVTFLPGLLGLIPLAALAAMLVYVGSRLASPSEFKHMHHIGPDQLFLFTATLLITLATDLLVGVGTGIALKLALHFWRGGRFVNLFRPTIEAYQEDNKTVRLVVRGSAAFPGLIKVKNALRYVSGEVHHVIVDVSDAVLVDHTFLSGVHTVFSERPDVQVQVVGLESFRAASSHPEASRWRKSDVA